MAKIDFEFESEYGIYKDAIVLPDDHTLSDFEIESIKKQRFDTWVAYIKETEKFVEEPQE